MPQGTLIAMWFSQPMTSTTFWASCSSRGIIPCHQKEIIGPHSLTFTSRQSLLKQCPKTDLDSSKKHPLGGQSQPHSWEQSRKGHSPGPYPQQKPSAIWDISSNSQHRRIHATLLHKHSAQMFVRLKPIRIGYKLWMLTSSDGFPYSVEIYTGKSENQPPGPLGIHGVRQLLQVVQRVSSPSMHSISFDSFSSPLSDLLQQLREDGFKATGTIPSNRSGRAHSNTMS